MTSFEARFTKYFDKLSGEEQYCIMTNLNELRKPDSWNPKIYPESENKVKK